MALPVQQQNGFAAPGSPAAEGKRDMLPRSAGADTARRRADDSRRLRKVKDSKEQLKRRTTRARGASYSTIDTTASNTSAGRSYTVANVNNGVIYLRYAHAQFWSRQTSGRAGEFASLLACLLALCRCWWGTRTRLAPVAMSANREEGRSHASWEAATDRPLPAPTPTPGGYIEMQSEQHG